MPLRMELGERSTSQEIKEVTMFIYEERVEELYEKKVKQKKRQGKCSFPGYEKYLEKSMTQRDALELAVLWTKQDEADARLAAVKQAVAEEMGWKRGRAKPRGVYSDPRYVEAKRVAKLLYWRVYLLEVETGYLNSRTEAQREARILKAEDKIEEYGGLEINNA